MRATGKCVGGRSRIGLPDPDRFVRPPLSAIIRADSRFILPGLIALSRLRPGFPAPFRLSSPTPEYRKASPSTAPEPPTRRPGPLRDAESIIVSSPGFQSGVTEGADFPRPDGTREPLRPASPFHAPPTPNAPQPQILNVSRRSTAKTDYQRVFDALQKTLSMQGFDIIFRLISFPFKKHPIPPPKFNRQTSPCQSPEDPQPLEFLYSLLE